VIGIAPVSRDMPPLPPDPPYNTTIFPGLLRGSRGLPVCILWLIPEGDAVHAR